MDYLQILSPIYNFLQCPTPQAWIDKSARQRQTCRCCSPTTWSVSCAAQTAMLLVRKYVADKQGMPTRCWTGSKTP